MRTVGIGAKKAPSDNVEELKKEISKLTDNKNILRKFCVLHINAL